MKHLSLRRSAIRVIAILLISVMLLSTFASCSGSRGKTLMKLGSSTISVNVYQLFLTRMKGTLARSIGSDVLSQTFWDQTIRLDGTTYNDYFTSEVLNNTKNYLVCLYLFDKYGLKLSDETVAAVDKKMEDLIVGDGDGSKSALNQILSTYGVNYNILREVYLLEAKLDALQAYLYGANGSMIADSAKEEFMQANYTCFRQIFLASYYYVYETDAYGNTVYYNKDETKYVYDTENGYPMIDEKTGKEIVDKFGTVIYFDLEAKPLYDTKNGHAVYVTDEDGNAQIKDYTEEELKQVEKQMEGLMEELKDCTPEEFEKKMREVSQDEDAVDEYTNGYYLSKNTTYGYAYLNDIVDALAELKTGETRLVKSSYGYHLIMKYDCEEGAYADKTNEVWFRDFIDDIIEYLFLEEAEKYKKDIIIDEKQLETVDMKSVSHNYYY